MKQFFKDTLKKIDTAFDTAFDHVLGTITKKLSPETKDKLLKNSSLITLGLAILAVPIVFYSVPVAMGLTFTCLCLSMVEGQIKKERDFSRLAQLVTEAAAPAAPSADASASSLKNTVSPATQFEKSANGNTPVAEQDKGAQQPVQKFSDPK